MKDSKEGEGWLALGGQKKTYVTFYFPPSVWRYQNRFYQTFNCVHSICVEKKNTICASPVKRNRHGVCAVLYARHLGCADRVAPALCPRWLFNIEWAHYVHYFFVFLDDIYMIGCADILCQCLILLRPLFRLMFTIFNIDNGL